MIDHKSVVMDIDQFLLTNFVLSYEIFRIMMQRYRKLVEIQEKSSREYNVTELLADVRFVT